RPDVRGTAFVLVASSELPGRYGAGHDLQLVRAGARAEEPQDRPALHAGRAERHRLQPGRYGDAPGPRLRAAVLALEVRERGHRGQIPSGFVQRLDLLS